MLNISGRQHAMSSARVIDQCDAHDIHFAMLKESGLSIVLCVLSSTAPTSIAVILGIQRAGLDFVSSTLQSRPWKIMLLGC